MRMQQSVFVGNRDSARVGNTAAKTAPMRISAQSFAVIARSTSQIRPLLTADQQTKLDAIQKAHQDMMNAHKELHDAMQE